MGRTRKESEGSVEADTKLDAKSKAIEKAKARVGREKAKKSYREPSDSEGESEKEVGKLVVDPKDKDFSGAEISDSISEKSESVSEYDGESSGSEYGKKKKKKTPAKATAKGRGRGRAPRKSASPKKGRGRGAVAKNGKKAPANRSRGAAFSDEDGSASEADSSGSEYGKKKTSNIFKKRPPTAGRGTPKKAAPGPVERRAGRAAKSKSYKEDSEEEEVVDSEEEVKPAAKKQKVEPKSKPKEKKEVSEEDVSGESDKEGTPKKAGAKKSDDKEEDKDSESGSEDEEKEKKRPVPKKGTSSPAERKGRGRPAKPTYKDDSEEDDVVDSEEDRKPSPKKQKVEAKSKGKETKKKDSEDDISEESDLEGGRGARKKGKSAPVERKGRGRPAAKSKSYKEVSEDDEEASEEERKPATKKLKVDLKPKSKEMKKKESEDDISEESDAEGAGKKGSSSPVERKGRGRPAAKSKSYKEDSEDEEAMDSDEGQKAATKKQNVQSKPKEDSDEEETAPGKKNGTRESKDEKEDKDSESGSDSDDKLKSKKSAVSNTNGDAEVDHDKSGPKNKTETDYSKIDFSCTKKSSKGDDWNFKISCWNIGGVRAWIKKNGMEYLVKEDPDIMCLNEVKCSEKTKPQELSRIEGYPHQYWAYNNEAPGHSGVAVFSKTEPKHVNNGFPIEGSDSSEDKKAKEEFNEEGRLITLEYDNFYLINAYVPNSGRAEKTDDYPKGYPPKVINGVRGHFDRLFKSYIQELEKKKSVIVTGDLNVAHEEIDLANPKTNDKTAGFTKEEREGMTLLLEETSLIDSFRTLYPDQTKSYTFWSYMHNAREKNIGWRLDYFLISQKLKDSLCENTMRPGVLGSDHCPIVLFLKN